MIKLNKKGLIFLPLLALCLSGCVSVIEPEDGPSQEEDYYTPEGEYDLDKDTDEGDSSTTIPTYSYSLVIQNKEDLEYISVTDESYTLAVSLLTYKDEVLDSSVSASASDVYISSTDVNIIDTDGLDLVLGTESGSVTLSVYWLSHLEAYDTLTINYTYSL